MGRDKAKEVRAIALDLPGGMVPLGLYQAASAVQALGELKDQHAAADQAITNDHRDIEEQFNRVLGQFGLGHHPAQLNLAFGADQSFERRFGFTIRHLKAMIDFLIA